MTDCYDPYMEIARAIMTSAVTEGDVDFFATNMGKTVCDCLDYTYERAIKRALDYRKKRASHIHYSYYTGHLVAIGWQHHIIGYLRKMGEIHYIADKNGRILNYTPYRKRKEAAMLIVEAWEVRGE